MEIQNISQRPGHVDLLYGTGPWGIDEIKDVPDDVGRKMLDHKDVYARPKAEEGKKADVKKVTPPAPVNSELQEFYDKLAVMTKQQAKEFIELKFNLKLDMRKFPTDDSLRAHARMLVEQYGMV